MSRGNWDLRALVNKRAGGADGALPAAKLSPLQTLAARDAPGRTSHSLHGLSGQGQVLIELFASGPVSDAAAERAFTITSDSPTPLVLHWGGSRADPNEWARAPEPMWPQGSVSVGEAGVDTPFARVQLDVAGGEGGGGAVPLQQLRIALPAGAPGGADTWAGLHFVLRSEDSSQWFKDGHNNFKATFVPTPPNAFAGAAAAAAALGPMAAQIVDIEGGNGWWSLMHRFNMCSGLLGQVLSGPAPTAQLAQLLVWLRYSSARHLTWQRNYNVKPKELSAAQQGLGQALSNAYAAHPAHREVLRAMLGTLGRGGDGGDGQRIRDEILHIMHRNNLKEVSGTWMEEWHQKLHNNTTPDDIVICIAYLAFHRGRGDTAAYWRILEEGGVPKSRMESFERPIRAAPQYLGHCHDQLTRDLEGYLRILKAVHAGADIDECLRCLGGRLPAGAGRALEYARRKAGENAPEAAVEGCAEARQELRSLLTGTKDWGLLREAIFLDIAIEDLARRCVERSRGDADAATLMRVVGWAAENTALTAGANEELLLSLLEWRRVQACGFDDPTWALRAKAGADRMRAALAASADRASALMQPFAEALGAAAKVPPYAVVAFSEEVIRGGSGFALSLALTRLDPTLRAAADLGAWQVISPVDAVGVLRCVPDLATVQSTVYAEPTVLIAERVGGGEEIPAGAVAVLTPSTVDVLSHSAVRARNTRTCFATCYDPDVLAALRKLEGKPVALAVKRSDITFAEADAAAMAKAAGGAAGAAGSTSAGTARPKALPAAKFGGAYAVPLTKFEAGVVGGKSRNTRALRERLAAGALPEWVQLPGSIAIPFGSFEAALDDAANKDVKAALDAAVAAIDVSTQASAETTLAACREVARRVRAPAALRTALLAEMKAAAMPALPESEERWEACLEALREVWASKWNVRAVLSLRQAALEHATLRMAVLVQRVVPADYAFVLHTTNPSTGDAGEIYGELVAGLGETLVGNYPGRALSFALRKDALASGTAPRVLGFPSKCVALRVAPTFIFRSDSNGEDLDGYAGAGLYDSIPVDAPSEEFVDYSTCQIVWDDAFRVRLLQRICAAGAAIETALGSAQDIEGCVFGEEIHIVQTRPQV
jgi:alpha-glucan,water dikinase